MFPGVGACAPRPGYAESFEGKRDLVARMKRSAIRGAVWKESPMFPGVVAFAPRPGYVESFPRERDLVARM
jgi:hypothetical protein